MPIYESYDLVTNFLKQSQAEILVISSWKKIANLAKSSAQ